jgi:hypothetical protein
MSTEKFTIFNADGRIVGLVTCPQEEVAAAVSLAGGVGYVAGAFPWERFRISQGVPVEFPAKPNPRYQWNWTTQAWADPRTLAQAKAEKNDEINRARAAANSSTFSYGGKTISVDALSRSDIDGANGIISLTGALPGGWPGAWKSVDNSYVLIPDIATWTAFYAAMVTQGTANFAYSQQLKATLAAATTIAEVDAITWSPT